MFWEFPLTVPTCNTNTNEWGTKEFQNKREFIDFIKLGWKLPGEYHLRNTEKWQETGNIYAKSVTKPNFEGGKYHPYIKGSPKFKQWAATEKERVKNGVIYDNNYIPPFYYWYINFCPIYDDIAKKRRFGDVWDSDLWYMQYIMLCLLLGKHAGGVKGRQKGYSFKHMAILYWCYCWFESSVNTVGGYLEDLVKKSWRYLEGYRNHINKNTPWKRGPQIPKSLMWNEFQLDASGTPRGNMAKLAGVTFKQRPDNDVGGAQTIFNYEEPGVAPTILQTIEFIRPACEKGSLTTGLIIACGSVGELEDAAGLQTIFYSPGAYNFLGMNNVWDKESANKECCIFISEAYNMFGVDEDIDDKGNRIGGTGEPFMDKDGNSNVKLALEWIERQKERLKKSNKKAELKQLALSQKCTSPEEAFADRKNSRFPLAKISRTIDFIREEKKKSNSSELPKKVDLDLVDGKITWKPSLKEEVPYPVVADREDKDAPVLIHKFPEPSPEMFRYFAGVDNIEVDETDTSDSLFSIYIYEGTTEVEYQDEDGNWKIRIEGDQIVASWTGRKASVAETNEYAELLVRMYNAFTLCERNKPNFITHMKQQGLSHLLAKESEVPIYKDIKTDYTGNDQVGMYMDSTGRKQKLCDDYLIIDLNTIISANEKLDKKGNLTGEYYKTYTKVETVRDELLLEELRNENKNTDRRDAVRLAVTLKSIWRANGFIKKKKEIPKQEVKTQPQTRVNYVLSHKRKVRAL